MKKKIQPSSLRRTFTTLLKIWAQAPDSTVRKGTKHKHAGGKGNMAHYVDQCKTDLSSPGKHLHELRKRTLLLERLRHVQPKYLVDEKGENCAETNPVQKCMSISPKRDPDNEPGRGISFDHLMTPPKNPSLISHNPQDSPAELRELNRLIDTSGVSTDTALKIQQIRTNTSGEQSLPPMISYPSRLPAPQVNNSVVQPTKLSQKW